MKGRKNQRKYCLLGPMKNRSLKKCNTYIEIGDIALLYIFEAVNLTYTCFIATVLSMTCNLKLFVFAPCTC